MAGELQISYVTGRTVYVLIRDRTSQVWNNLSGNFQSYNSVLYPGFPVSLTEQGTSGGGYYAGTFPTSIAAGVYALTGKVQVGGSPAETDATIGIENYQWNGAATFPLSDLAISGQLKVFNPTRGVAIPNFPVYLKSAVDHITPFVSGVLSGQIARDGGTFGPLQSGAFTETGLGYYTLQALTSGDLTANTVKLLFTATGVSGGVSDPLPMSLVLQRSSGQ